MHAPNPNLKKKKIPSLFQLQASLAKKNRFRMEPADSGKKTGFVWNQLVQAKKLVPYGTGLKRFRGPV
jgi:hypothetical protein